MEECIQILEQKFFEYCSCYLGLCSYDLGLCFCVPVIEVHLLVYFYSNLMNFYVLNFFFIFLNFVKINKLIFKIYMLMCHG